MAASVVVEAAAVEDVVAEVEGAEEAEEVDEITTRTINMGVAVDNPGQTRTGLQARLRSGPR
jgi:hypothetical protein